jgi:signal-transduction protein with cAMP-binding, CBS, and nucleotidyltransferase domain
MKRDWTIIESKRMEIILCGEQTPLGEVAQIMVDEDISAVVVVDELGVLSGIITRTDLLRVFCDHEDWLHLPTKEYMSTDVVTVMSNELLYDTARLLVEKRIHRVVVVREIDGQRKPIGVVSAADLLYHMVKSE